MIYNKLKFSILTLSILSILSLNAFGQLFDSEQNPLSVKWRQINTSGFQFIYPAELEKEAQRMANTIPSIYPYIGRSLSQQQTRLPIVFQNRGTLANGFVQLAPKKSQFYTTPPQQYDSQDWLNNLAVHELRHVAQFDKITGRKKFFLTEEIYFAYLGASVPTWFFEGDAVSIETALTKAGRGRQPSWIMPFRTSLLSGKNFSYSKSYFGSNKDQTAGYYQLGYLITCSLRSSYGKAIIDSLLTDINEHPVRLSPFTNSLKKFTSHGTKAYYQKVVGEIKNQWEKQAMANVTEDYVSLNRPSSYATNYYLPTAVGDERILTLKQSKAETPGFVLIGTDKSEEKLFKIGYQEQAWFSYGNGKLVWDEIRYDPRYKQRSYSVICMYDFSTKRKHQLTAKTRLFSPTLSADGKHLVAVQIDLSNLSNLVQIDLESGKVLKVFENPENFILQTPALNHNGSAVAFVAVNEKGKSLWEISSTGKTTKLIEESNHQLGRPVFLGDQIAFNAHFSGIDNVYRINPTDHKITALTAAKYGAFNASLTPDGKSIIFNNYQLMGPEIAKTPMVERPVSESHFVYFGAAAEEQEHTGNIFEKIPDSTFTSGAYKPLSHLFNFHSVSFAVDEDDQLAIRLKSNDLLNTLEFYAGLAYDADLRKIAYQAGFSFKSLYPLFTASFKNRPRTGFYRIDNDMEQANWRENYLNLRATLPLSINVYHHNYSFVAEVGTSYTQRNFGPREAPLFNKTLKFPMNYALGFSHSIRSAERDVAPRWAQTLNISYFNRPFDRNLTGELLAFQSAFYFPGLAKNHSFMASFNYQESSGTLSFNNEINTVYGYGQITATSELHNTLLLNYRFPIAFPDAEIGSLAYIRNFRGGVFSHYENIGLATNLTQPKTFGLELRSSMNLLRYQPVIDLGARLVFVNKTYHQNPILEFIFNYSF